MDLLKLKKGFVFTWICQNCYMDSLKLLLRFIKVVTWICQSCSMYFLPFTNQNPSSNLTKNWKLVEASALNQRCWMSQSTQYLGSLWGYSVNTITAMYWIWIVLCSLGVKFDDLLLRKLRAWRRLLNLLNLLKRDEINRKTKGKLKGWKLLLKL